MRYLLVALVGLIATGVLAQSPINSFPPGMFASRSDPATFVGPGDIVSGALYWYGLRAYSASYAASLGNSISVIRASDSASQIIKVKADGSLDVASANSFAGTDATCTGTISGTTLTCTGASSTPHALSTLTGTGLVQPVYIISCGTFTGGAGTCTLNSSQTVSVGETITMQYSLVISRLYDQTGHSFDGVTINPSRNAQFLPSCINGLPCINFVQFAYYYTSGFTPTTAQPYSMSAVAQRNNKFTGFNSLIQNDNSATVALDFNNSANTAVAYAGSFGTAAANDNALHALNALYSGASSFLNVDGTDNSVSSGTSSFFADAGSGPFVGNDVSDTGRLDGYLMEAGFWSVGFSAGNRTSMCHNMRLYWGTSGLC